MPEASARGKIAERRSARENARRSELGTEPRSRVVLLGASNLTLAFPRVVERLRALRGAPLELLAALGHGRSYGRSSRVLLRELPGIVDCGLWPALDSAPERETVALLADLGNDLVYGADVEEIAGWIALVLRRLGSHRARTALVRLPLASLERLSRWRFGIARALIYPSHRIEFETLRRRARELDERVAALAREHGATLVEQPESWYGLDPAHIRPSRRADAWDALLAPLGEGAARVEAPPLAASELRALAKVRPERRRWMGREERHAQPCAQLLDGTRISVY
jgi:hypothetical protein